MGKTIKIKVRWKKTIYENNGFVIAKYDLLDSYESEIPNDIVESSVIVCKGNDLPVSNSVFAEFIGVLEPNNYKGKTTFQLKVSSSKEIIPEDAEGFEKYLLKGNIPGIGEILAKRIIEQFGDDSYDILFNKTEKLIIIKGVTPKKIDRIINFLSLGKITNKIIDYFDGKISTEQTANIYNAFGSGAIEKLEESIFWLYATDTFKYSTISELARSKNRLDVNDLIRIDASLVSVMEADTKQGHTYMLGDDLIAKATKLLGRDNIGDTPEYLISRELFVMSNPLQRSPIIRENVEDKVIYSLEKYYQAEKNAAINIIKSLKYPEISIDPKIMEEYGYEDADELKAKILSDYASQTKMILSPQQKKAVLESTKQRILIITGGPGTGKTTIEKFIIHMCQTLRPKEKIMLMAPTGRAAGRMAESTGFKDGASTIHSAIKIFGESDRRKFRGVVNLDADIILIDETSMVDSLLLNCLLDTVKEGTQLIYIGDPDQLPSVGPGNVFKDMIDSKTIPVVKLDHVFRQGPGSMISVNADLINKGNTDVIWNPKDFTIIPVSAETDDATDQQTTESIEKVYTEYLSKDYSFNDVQILTPFRKAENKKRTVYRHTSVEALNQRLQPIANSNCSNKQCGLTITYFDGGIEKKKEFYPGDKIMETKNNDIVSNGDIGIINNISVVDKKVESTFNGHTPVELKTADLNTIELAYSTTIHKSQGSEYPIVIIPLLKSYKGMLSRQLLYTAITRAKKKVIFIGEMSAFFTAVRDDYTVSRRTSLKRFLIDCMENNVTDNDSKVDEKKEDDSPKEEQLSFDFS